MRFDTSERVIKRFLGFFLCADVFLQKASRQLGDDFVFLGAILPDENLRKDMQAFIDVARIRYEGNRRSILYNFASVTAQREYDAAWHRVGFTIKDYQERELVARGVLDVEWLVDKLG